MTKTEGGVIYDSCTCMFNPEVSDEERICFPVMHFFTLILRKNILSKLGIVYSSILETNPRIPSFSAGVLLNATVSILDHFYF